MTLEQIINGKIIDIGEVAIFYIMGISSLIAFAVFIERLIVFWNRSKGAEKSISTITNLIRTNNLNGIKEYTEKSKSNVFTRFADFSMEHYTKGEQSLMELQSGKMVSERIELEKRLPILSTLGNNAPFIGLLGTVLGVIKAFNNLGTLGNTGAEVVMKSISTALLATAAGLFVAIPVVMANNYFSKKMKVILQRLEILSKEFLASYHYKKD